MIYLHHRQSMENRIFRSSRSTNWDSSNKNKYFAFYILTITCLLLCENKISPRITREVDKSNLADPPTVSHIHGGSPIDSSINNNNWAICSNVSSKMWKCIFPQTNEKTFQRLFLFFLEFSLYLWVSIFKGWQNWKWNEANNNALYCLHSGYFGRRNCVFEFTWI